MQELWLLIEKNLSFVIVSLVIVAAMALLARLAERFLPSRHRVSSARRITIVAVCSAIAAILHMLDFPLPFAPGFYKVDFSEVPVMLCGFFLGPSAAVASEGVKILLKLLLKGTGTAFVGDFANFVVGCTLVLPAAIIYHVRKNRSMAVWGLLAGTLIMTVFGSLFNAVYLLPKFSELYGAPMEALIAMGTKVNPHIHSVSTLVLMAVVPLNLLKGLAVTVLTLLLYKHVARPLFGRNL